MIYIGTAGWAYKDWEGVFYPIDLKKDLQLSYYANYFDTVEINSSFYRIPDERIALSWCKKVEKNSKFLFTLKAFSGWTHSDDLKKEDFEKIKNVLKVLKEGKRFGLLLFQFPYRIKFSLNFLNKLNLFKEYFEDFSIGVEVRNKTFQREEFFNFLRANNISFANIDQPIISGNIGPTSEFTSAPGYIRLHGRNSANWFTADKSYQRYDYLYTKEELLPWVECALKLSKEGDVFVILNNHYRGKAIQNSFDFINLLKEHKGNL